MDPEAYRLMAALEADHWWYRGRRAVVRRLLETLELPARSRILDVGCGTGANLELLGRFGEVVGLEPTAELRRPGPGAPGRVIRGRAQELPLRDGGFDLVAALDVLEHLHDELVALDEIHRVLRPAGYLVLHVPAYGFLWGHEDRISRHRRRYRASEIRRLLEAARFEPLHVGYTTVCLFPAIALAKIAKRWLFPGGAPRSDVARLPPRALNEALGLLLEAEAEVTATAELPFGASVLALARRS